MELHKMSDQDLIKRMSNYMEVLEVLIIQTSKLLDNSRKDSSKSEEIRRLYGQLKADIKTDASYVSKVRNKIYDNSIYSTVFSPAVNEAAVSLKAFTNSHVNEELINSIIDAREMISYYYDQLDEIAKKKIGR